MKRKPRKPRSGWAFEQVLDNARRTWGGIADALNVDARAKGAALLYRELSKLPNAELERRGTSRADLPRYILKTLNKR